VYKCEWGPEELDVGLSKAPTRELFNANYAMTRSSSLGLIALFITAFLVQAQEFPECTRELIRTDDCADVINPNACYNQFRWNSRTLSCIDGVDDADRRRKVLLSQPSQLEPTATTR